MFSKRKLIFIFLILISISLISAQEIRFTGEEGTNIQVTETCSFNELPCPNTFKCNITIENPTQEILVLNKQMTRDNSVYNYTLNESQTSSIGIYEVKQVYCTDGNNNGTSSFFFRITYTGAEPIDTGKGIVILGIFLILILLIVFFLIFGILTTNIPFKIFFVALSVLMMVSTVGFSVAIMQQMLGSFSGLITTYGNFYILLTILLTAGGIGLFVYLTVVALKSMESTKHFFKTKENED